MILSVAQLTHVEGDCRGVLHYALNLLQQFWKYTKRPVRMVCSQLGFEPEASGIRVCSLH